MAHDEPVPRKERESNPGGVIFGCDIRKEVPKRDQPVKNGKVERPDSQDTPHIERLDVDVSRLLSLTQQKLHNEKRTQQKENWNTKRSGRTNGNQERMHFGVDRHVVE